LDVVVFGATGFVGRLVAAYLAEHAPPGTRIGLAGRSVERLAAVRDGLPARAASWPLVVADAGDPASLAALAARTHVVATTVGPYLRYGLPLVAACAEVGTHYADLTGEILFVRDSLRRYDRAAKASGARIVHSCGFDSIPSDLGVLLLHEQAAADAAGELDDVRLVVVAMRGGVSGGTIDSMRVTAQAVAADRGLLRVLSDPYALSPDRSAEPDLGRQSDLAGVHRDPDLGVWVGTFVMASYNTRVVRMSNTLQGRAYGRRMRYREAMSYGPGITAPVIATTVPAVLGVAVAGMTFRPTRALLDRILPKPGEGPAERTRTKGRFRMDLRAVTSSGARYGCVVAAQGDPGYAATSVMLGESALCLALDSDQLPHRAGVLTPATAMGDALVDRLRAAGFTLSAGRR
jgi:short subunit dehydrogenase-like uncharacterized protein